MSELPVHRYLKLPSKTSCPLIGNQSRLRQILLHRNISLPAERPTERNTHCVCSSSCRLLCLGQFNFLRGAADAIGWAHCVCKSSRRLFRLGQFNYPGGAADAIGWAHCVCSSSCRLLRLGQFIFLGGAADAIGWAHCAMQRCCRLFRLGQFIFLEGAADAIGWAYVFAAVAADYLTWANLNFWEVVLML